MSPLPKPCGLKFVGVPGKRQGCGKRIENRGRWQEYCNDCIEKFEKEGQQKTAVRMILRARCGGI